MNCLRPLSILALAFLAGCGDSGPPPVNYSSGFFATFDQMVDSTMARRTADEKVTQFSQEFGARVAAGPSADEVHAVGSTWDKVSAFLDVGLISSDAMAGVNNSAQARVDMFTDAADSVLRSDYGAITAYNQTVAEGYQIRPTTDIVWESLHLLLATSARAEFKVSTAKGEQVAGHWTHTTASQRDLWVNGYYQTVWHPETCRDEYVGTDCAKVWVDPACTDVWIDDGYWESTCSKYDENDQCVEWKDVWVDTSYYETQCSDGYYQEQCTDVYQSVCDAAYWEDVYIAEHVVKGARISGELAWVAEHTAEEAYERVMAMPEQEALILNLGIQYVASFGPEYVPATCQSALQTALDGFGLQTPEDSVKTSRGAILHCLSRH